MSATFLAAAEQRALDACVAKPAKPAAPSSPFAQVLALLMAQHPRLGAHSPAAKLTVDCTRRILLELTHAIVVDMGSGLCKAGFVCGRDRPHSVFRTVVARSKSDPTSGNVIVGEDALAARATHRLRYPVEHGITTSWEDAERVWHHIFFDQLRVGPEERPVLITEPPLNPKPSRERLAQIMFETFNVPALNVSIGAVLALFATGRTTGLVIDSGEGATHAVPVYEAYVVPHGINRLDIAGRDVDQQLERLLVERGRRTSQGALLASSSFEQTASLPADRAALEALVRDIKEKHAHVAPSARFDSQWHEAMAFAALETEESNAVAYTLPDGHLLRLGKELSKCTEALFDPSVIGFSAPGITDVAFSTIMSMDLDIRKEMFANVVLAGGTAVCRGFADRLQTELTEMAPLQAHVEVVPAAADGTSASWCGGALLASLPQFSTMWITRKAYDEEGPGVVHGTKSFCF